MVFKSSMQYMQMRKEKKDIGIFILRMWIRCDWNDAVD